MRSLSLDSAFTRSKDALFRDLDGEAVILTWRAEHISDSTRLGHASGA